MKNVTLDPNTFEHNNAYVDKISYFLTGNEEKVLNHIIREIKGFQGNSVSHRASIAISTLVSGKKTGERISWGCGLKAGAVRNALNVLCQFGLISKIGEPTQDGQCYELQLDWEQINWEAMYARKAAQDEAFKQQVANARANNPACSTLRHFVELGKKV